MSTTEIDPAAAALPPRFSEALSRLADQRHDEAIILCEQMLSERPDCPEALMLLGLVSFELDEPMQAVDLLTRAHETAPEIADFAEALASVQARLGNTAEALFLTKLAMTLEPHPSGVRLLPDAYANFFENVEAATPNKFRKRAERMLATGNLAEAEAAAETQLRLTPGDPATLHVLTSIWRRSGQKHSAIAALHAILHTEPALADRCDLAQTLSEAGRHREAALVAASTVREAPDDAEVAHKALRIRAHDPDRDAAEIDAEKRAWCNAHLRPIVAARAERPEVRERPCDDDDAPLSLGFVGNRLCDAETIHMLTPVIAGLDRRGARIHLYCDDDRETVLTDQLTRHAKRRVSLNRVDPETAAAIMRGDALDIAIDLAGHGPDNRLTTFAWQPAPVRVSWAGSMLPTGGPFDWLLTGPRGANLPGLAAGSGGTAWQLPATAMVYPAPSGLGEPSPLPALGNRHATFGSAMDLAAIGRPTLDLWAALLDAVPTARLLIANVAHLDDACVALTYEMLSHYGLRQRVDVIDLDAGIGSQLEFWRHVDIAVDPQPFGSFSHTSRALWSGVPTIAIEGDRFAGRTGAAALAAAGRDEWIAAGAVQAREIACRLLADAGTLAQLRSELPGSVAASALADGDLLAERLMQVFGAMRREVAAAA